MLKLEHKQEQTQMLSSKMIESLSVLQMSRCELSERLENLYAENPLVELAGHDEAVPPDGGCDSLNKLEWLAGFDEQNAAYFSQDSDDDGNWLENIAAPQQETIADSLMEQMAGRGFGDDEMLIFRYIAENLDERGYFKDGAAKLAARFGISEAAAKRCLDEMKKLDPPGICAGGLVECLTLQLERRGGDNEVEKEIIERHLEAFAKRQFQAIAQKLKIPVSRVSEALDKIRQLNPKPANGLADGEPAAYTFPDVTVTLRSGNFYAELNFDAGAALGINRSYLELARRGDCPEEVRRYITGKAKEIEQISTNIRRRNETLTRLANCLTEEQRNFFLRGRTGLRPLRMKTVAARLGLHESTISRAVSGKYLQCRWGVFSMSYFFTKGYSLESGVAEIAIQQVKEKLKAVIAREDKNRPHSDKELSAILSMMGIDISRRTVAKYRGEMGIGDCRARRFPEGI